MTTPHSREEAVKIISEVYAKAMIDPVFYAEFVREPNRVLAEYGLRSPEGVYYHLVHEYREGDESLPKSGGIDVYLAFPVPEEAVDFEAMAVVDDSGGNDIKSFLLSGFLTTVCGISGADEPPDENPVSSNPQNTITPGIFPIG